MTTPEAQNLNFGIVEILPNDRKLNTNNDMTSTRQVRQDPSPNFSSVSVYDLQTFQNLGFFPLDPTYIKI